jgi:2-polyprenyl-3-methyl-5-hydroxy-6-metoxy-1,4-benzoquinol methylase
MCGLIGSSASIIDIGGGESTLVDDLLARGYQNVTVLDVSQTAIDVTKRRLGAASERVNWLVADIGKGELAPRAYDVWHDRAVFHFLTAVKTIREWLSDSNGRAKFKRI